MQHIRCEQVPSIRLIIPLPEQTVGPSKEKKGVDQYHGTQGK